LPRFILFLIEAHLFSDTCFQLFEGLLKACLLGDGCLPLGLPLLASFKVPLGYLLVALLLALLFPLQLSHCVTLALQDRPLLLLRLPDCPFQLARLFLQEHYLPLLVRPQLCGLPPQQLLV
jgi:hypothetical protein